MDQVDGLVDSTEGSNIDGLSADNTAGTDTGGVFTSAAKSKRVDQDLEWVETSQQVDELHSLLDDLHGQLLLAVVPTARDHDHVNETLNNGALNFLEFTLLVATGRVRNIDLLLDTLDLEVSRERHVAAFDALIGPLSEKLRFNCEFGLNAFDRVFIINFGVHHSLQRI